MGIKLLDKINKEETAKVARALLDGTCDHGLRQEPGEHLGLYAYDVDRQHVPGVSGITIS